MVKVVEVDEVEEMEVGGAGGDGGGVQSCSTFFFCILNKNLRSNMPAIPRHGGCRVECQYHLGSISSTGFNLVEARRSEVIDTI